MAKKMRKTAIDMAFNVGKKGAHLGAGLSSIEILACLYGGIMNINPKNPNWEGRDYFIPSKAHCVLSYYTALAYSGFFEVDELNSFELNESELSGHPVMNLNKGIEFSGGSLGMGLSQGVGIALSRKRKKGENNIFVLIGDGECNEGAIWEASMSATNFKLDNLIVIIDNNKLQYDGETDYVMNLYSLYDKFSAFGFNVCEANGHNIEDLYYKLQESIKLRNGKPTVIIADTIKGKGITFIEGKKEWHHAVLSEEQYNLAVKELKEENQYEF
ncbi:transketolase [Clostridium beijerinckii]|uniref:Transketolase n=2 Tax=Clostridium beijerinckii TaxID=1520 RepID=A0A7X9SJY6_CLOBE|nr:transketolase [Clostridium beijerinckii]